MPELPDYFDRLLARHAPAPAAGPLPGLPADAPDTGRPARVRPRLPGPFERIESLRAGDRDEPGTAPGLLTPPTAHPHLPGAEFTRVEREVRTTERETVVRDGPTAPDAPDGSRDGGPRPAAPLLRPAGPLADRARPATAGTVRPRRPSGAPPDDGTPSGRTPAPLTTPRATAAPAPAALLRPRDDAAARGAAARKTAAGRRGGRPAEQVVHVHIGRLEVTAAGGPARKEPVDPGRAVRRGPALSLTDYLSRDEKRN